MRTEHHVSSFTAAWWVLHAVVIAGLCYCGMFLGQWLVAILQEPVVTGDLASEWWQIFRKFAAIATGSLFVGVLVGYVLLILPDQ